MREPPLRQRYTAMLRQLIRSRIHPALTSFATGDAACWRTSPYLGVPAPLVIVGTRLQDELLEKTETYRTFRHPERQQFVAGRRKAEIRLRSAKGCLASRYLRKSRLPGVLRSGAPAKVLVFMQLSRLPPHYVMRCGPIDLVTTSPRRLR
jgi:hypothetical protein